MQVVGSSLYTTILNLNTDGIVTGTVKNHIIKQYTCLQKITATNVTSSIKVNFQVAMNDFSSSDNNDMGV